MSKKSKSYQPKTNKCDLIEEILLGNQRTKTLNKKLHQQFSPQYIIKKFEKIISETSSDDIRKKAKIAVILLQAIPINKQNKPLEELERRRIYKETNKKANILVTISSGPFLLDKKIDQLC